MCLYKFHGSPGQHCCGTDVYCPQLEICCNGHRHPKEENSHCCGVHAYNIKDPQKKCCAGTLYNVTLLGKRGGHQQCCGSILLTTQVDNILQNQAVCCSSEDQEVVYPAKTGFRCCGHLYYNSSLWSCCAWRLSPVHQLGQHPSTRDEESRLVSVNNLKETDLCKKMHIGTVESVSLYSIVFSNVLIIHGQNGTVKPLPLHYILQTPERCNFPKLIRGKAYFFDQVKVYTDFNHDLVLQSIHFIISKCFL
ncbi:uncharacterized protein [Embiotoca jacksoni]|uniref:uncharacterized protein n=1 Tax=Embiotoca jacksoni TaxID=100190 RepID=UPI003704C5B3